MDMSKVTKFFGKVGEFASENSPAILTGLNVLGIVATAVCAYRSGIIASDILEERREKIDRIDPEKEDIRQARKEINIETTKKMIPVMAPTVIMGCATGACAIGANTISSKRIAMLSAAYSLSETAVKELNDKMSDMLGAKKARSIKDSILQDKIDKNPPSKDGSPIIMTGDGNVLCYDSYSGRYFHSNAQKIQQAANTLMHDLQTENYVCLNDFYDLINIPKIPMGDALGWNVDHVKRGEDLISISPLLSEDQNPCICVDYDAELRGDFRRLH